LEHFVDERIPPEFTGGDLMSRFEHFAGKWNAIPSFISPDIHTGSLKERVASISQQYERLTRERHELETKLQNSNIAATVDNLLQVRSQLAQIERTVKLSSDEDVPPSISRIWRVQNELSDLLHTDDLVSATRSLFDVHTTLGQIKTMIACGVNENPIPVVAKLQQNLRSLGDELKTTEANYAKHIQDLQGLVTNLIS
jgi:uncharacterized protein YukE